MQKGFEVVNLHGTASGVIAVPVIGENGNWWIGNEDTGVCAGGSGSSATNNVYSTEETICGTWIDGKPIYRKVISGKMEIENGTYVFADVSVLEISQLINLYGNMTENTNHAHITIQTSYDSIPSINAAVNMYYCSTQKKIMCILLNNNGLYSGATAYVVLEYTK